MENKILTILAKSTTGKSDMSEIIHELFYSIEQLESYGMIKAHRSFSGSKINSLEITKLGREFYKEKILKK